MWIFDAGHSWLVFISRVRPEMKGASKESAPGNHSNSRRALHTYDQSLHWSIGPTLRRRSRRVPAWNELDARSISFSRKQLEILFTHWSSILSEHPRSPAHLLNGAPVCSFLFASPLTLRYWSRTRWEPVALFLIPESKQSPSRVSHVMRRPYWKRPRAATVF